MVLLQYNFGTIFVQFLYLSKPNAKKYWFVLGVDILEFTALNIPQTSTDLKLQNGESPFSHLGPPKSPQ